MRVVTSIEQQQRDEDRLSVFLDGRFWLGVSRTVAASHGLRVGAQLSDEQVADVERSEAVDRSFEAALNFLSYRQRSRRELEIWLRRRGTEPDASEAVLARLEGLGLVDDLAFARFWVENRQSFRPRGTRALRMELRGKGIAGEVIDEALDDLGDEEETAYRAGLKRVRSLQRLDDRDFFARMVAFLQRRGFPYGVAAAATRRLLEDRGRWGDEMEDVPLDDE